MPRPAWRAALLSSEPWDDVWRRNQQLASRIPGTLFVEPAMPGLRTRVRREGCTTVLTPAKPLPLRWELGRRLHAWIAARALGRQGGESRLLAWVTHPLGAATACALGGPVLYDRTDDWPRMEQSSDARRFMDTLDRSLLRRADAVVVVSERMREQLARETHLIPNGVDAARFAGTPPRRPRSNLLRIGFAGTIDPFRVDMSVLQALNADPSVQLVLVGPGELLRGAEHHGVVPHRAIPELLASCDALVAPYRTDCAANRTSDSLKLYEYFATGLPVIATAIAGFERHPDLVISWPLRASLRDEMAAQLSNAGARRAVAQQADWSERAAAMEALLAQLAGAGDSRLDVAAVIVTYNSEQHIGSCLSALLEQLPERDILVWDNASTDDTAVRVMQTVPGIALERSERNLGFAAAVNRAAQLMPGRDLLLVNPDAMVGRGATAALTNALREDPSIAVAGARLRAPDGGLSPHAWAFPTPLRTIAGAGIGLGRAYAVRERQHGQVADVGDAFVPFTVALLRRTVFDRLGGLDEAYWMYGEDSDYCFRARRGGWRIAIADPATATHVGGASSSDPAARQAAVLRGGDQFRRTHFSGWQAALAAAGLRAGAAARLGFERVAQLVVTEARPRDEWREVLRHYRR